MPINQNGIGRCGVSVRRAKSKAGESTSPTPTVPRPGSNHGVQGYPARRCQIARTIRLTRRRAIRLDFRTDPIRRSRSTVCSCSTAASLGSNRPTASDGPAVLAIGAPLHRRRRAIPRGGHALIVPPDTPGATAGNGDRAASGDLAEECPRLVLGIVTLMAIPAPGDSGQDATGLPGGVSRSPLATRQIPSRNVTIHRASRWHSGLGEVAVVLARNVTIHRASRWHFAKSGDIFSGLHVSVEPRPNRFGARRPPICRNTRQIWLPSCPTLPDRTNGSHQRAGGDDSPLESGPAAGSVACDCSSFFTACPSGTKSFFTL